MSIKESSDEPNPDMAVSEAVDHVVAKRGPGDYLALAIATFGVGYLPIAPGTWGSLVGVAIYLLLRLLAFDKGPRTFLFIELIVLVVVTLAGIGAASRTEHLTGLKDPGKVVVDEVSGQLIALLPVSMVSVWSWKITVIVSFILFRFFDIVKPYPVRRMEHLSGGLGIMFDDLLAGLYAGLFILLANVLLGSF